MKQTLTAIAAQTILCFAAFAQQTHLDIMVPNLMNTDLTGRVKSVDTKVSVNVSGEFEREFQEYDRIGNLLNETEWDPEGKCLHSLTNYYDENGNYERQIYIDYEDGYTNDWEVILKPETRQMALKKKGGAAIIRTYSPAGYLLNYRKMDEYRDLKRASVTRRDAQNRRLEYTRMDDKNEPVYTYWFKWKDGRLIDRERQKYHQEETERLHIYDYIETDPQGNWTQRLRVRYDIGGKEKKKVSERIVTRTIEYFEEEETDDIDVSETVSTNLTTAPSASDSTNSASFGETASVAEAGSTTAKMAVDEAGDSVSSKTPPAVAEVDADASDDHIDVASVEFEQQPEESMADIQKGIDYAFEDISDKVVIVTCKSREGRSHGSGFVARMNEKTYLFTNQHVILGSGSFRLKTTHGESLIPRRVELSKTRDVARILIDEREGFEMGQKISLGMPVGVFGNSEGAGVATELLGEVTDFGVDVVEVTAEFVAGNSGSPVLNSQQEVVGIASYIKVTWDPPSEEEDTWKSEDESKDENKEPDKTRRFCYRLNDLEWKPVKWNEYNGKYGNLYREGEAISAAVSEMIAIWSNDPMESLPCDDDLASDLVKWVKGHNQLISRYKRRAIKYRSFMNAYSENLMELSKSCRARSKRIAMFSKQRELTGFLEDSLNNHASALEDAAVSFEIFAAYLHEKASE